MQNFLLQMGNKAFCTIKKCFVYGIFHGLTTQYHALLLCSVTYSNIFLVGHKDDQDKMHDKYTAEILAPATTKT